MKKSRRQVATVIEVSPGAVVSIGELVSYYSGGWRCGHLESITGNILRIRPIGTGYGAPRRAVNIPVTNVKKEEKTIGKS